MRMGKWQLWEDTVKCRSLHFQYFISKWKFCFVVVLFIFH